MTVPTYDELNMNPHENFTTDSEHHGAESASARDEYPGEAGDGIEPDFDFATNEDMARLDISTRWVWKNWLQNGAVNLLAAEGGIGKTRFMADICRRLHTGSPWPDGSATAEFQGKFLAMWVAGDRNHAELVTMSEAFGFGDRICYSGSRQFPMGDVSLNEPADFKKLYRRVKAAKPMFLVIDTAGGTTSLNMGKQEDAGRFFAPLCDLASNLGICVVVITHLNANKQTLGRRSEERVRCVIRMSAESKEPSTPRRLEVVKSNGLYLNPLGMLLGETGNSYECPVPPSPEEVEKGTDGGTKPPKRITAPKRRECMDWLRVHLAQPMRVAQILKDVKLKGYSTGLLYDAKDEMNVCEVLDEKKHKWWRLPSDTQSAS